MPVSQYKTVLEFENRVEDYFENTPVEKQTRAGLCVYLGMTKQSFQNYRKREGFGDVVDFALTRLEYKYELQLNEKSRPGDMFALKQYGWVDKQEVENKMTGGIQIISNIPRPDEE